MPVILPTQRAAAGIRVPGPAVFNRGALAAQGLQFYIEPRQGVVSDLTKQMIGSATFNADAFVRGSVLGGEELVCDGTGDYATYANQAPLNFNGTANWTIAFWLYWKTQSSYATPFELTTGSGGSARKVDLFFDSSQCYFELNVGGSINASASSSQPFTTGSWQLCCVTRNGAAMKLYRNGLPSVALGSLAGGAAVGDTGGALYLGGTITSTGNTGWNGFIGPVGVWNYTKTDNEIWTLWDPRSRWDIYGTAKRSLWAQASAPAFDAATFPHLVSRGPFNLPPQMIPSGRMA